MSIKWEVFTQRSSRSSSALRVSINKRSIFSLNQKAFEALKEPTFVELLFSKPDKLIGIRPLPTKIKHAYQLKKQGKSNSYIIRAGDFFGFNRMTPKASGVFDDAKVDETGVLILNAMKLTPIINRRSSSKPQIIETPPENPKQNVIDIDE
jgi:hypothetical protein